MKLRKYILTIIKHKCLFLVNIKHKSTALRRYQEATKQSPPKTEYKHKIFDSCGAVLGDDQDHFSNQCKPGLKAVVRKMISWPCDHCWKEEDSIRLMCSQDTCEMCRRAHRQAREADRVREVIVKYNGYLT